MAHELPAPLIQSNYGEEMPHQKESLVESRERFFVPVSLNINRVFCADDREPDTDEDYIHLLGGALNPIYGLITLKEMTEPGSTNEPFEHLVVRYMPVVREVGGMKHPGVHSDVKSESKTESEDQEHMHVDLDCLDGPVGCGLAEKCQDISQLLFEQGDDIIAEMVEDTPALFESERGFLYAQAIKATHGRLAANPTLFTSGRRVVLAAARSGADTMLVRGSHAADVGIISLDRNTSARTGQALKEGLPFYLEDSGIVHQIYENMSDIFPYDMLLVKIQEQMHTRATMRFLGVKTIGIREASTVPAPSSSTVEV
jgi:hypothetical protein